MRALFTILAWSALAMTAQAATFVYVSMAPEQKIQVYRLDATSGDLAPVESFSVDGSPGSLNPDPKRQYLFASLRTTNSLARFRIDQATGKLTAVGSAALPKNENAAFVATDRTGRWLLSASYNAGTVVVHRLSDDGRIESPAIQTVTTSKTAHCVAIESQNKLLFVPHVAPNAVFQFRFDETSGKLTELGQVPGGTEGAGPRHLAFHPNSKFAYTSDESGSSITAYRLDPATGLTSQQTLSTLPTSYTGKNSTAEVKVHPSGKFVWVSNRGHDSLAVFAINATTGKLTALDQTPTEKTPRSFEIDPSGKFIFGAGEGSGKLAVFRVDQATGKLDRIKTLDVGKSLTWVVAVPVGSE